MNCLIEFCPRKAKTRGLCASHYQVLSSKVSKQELTWFQLEQCGMALPSKRLKSGLVQSHLDRVRLSLLKKESK